MKVKFQQKYLWMQNHQKSVATEGDDFYKKC